MDSCTSMTARARAKARQLLSVVDGMFCGLPLDEDNESEKTDERLQSLSRLIMQEAII